MLLEFPRMKISAEADALERLSVELDEIKQAQAALRSRRRAVLNRYQAEVKRRLRLGLPAALVLALALSLTTSPPGRACRAKAAFSPGVPVPVAVLACSAASIAPRIMRR